MDQCQRSRSEGKTYQALVTEALISEMHRDPNVVLMGWEVSHYRPNLQQIFGHRRVIDMPIAELSVFGVAAGAARCGKRPVIDLIGSSFFFLAWDQIVNHASFTLDLLGGEIPMSLVLRGLHGIIETPAAPVHSRMPHPLLMAIPGLRVVYPSSPEDAKVLFSAAIRDPGPVIFLEHTRLYLSVAGDDEVEESPRLGQAAVKRSGEDITVVAIGPMVNSALMAASMLEQENISVEVIDPRTLAPLDFETILQSVNRTGRLIVVDEAHDTCSAASHISAVVTERAWDRLQAPVRRLTVPDMTIPFNVAGEWEVIVPTEMDIAELIREVYT